MDAPTYPPAQAFEPPVVVPLDALTTQTASLLTLMSSPAAWAIVVKHAPIADALSHSPMFDAFGNATVDAFVAFGDVSPDAIVAIDAELAQLPRSQWPSQ